MRRAEEALEDDPDPEDEEIERRPRHKPGPFSYPHIRMRIDHVNHLLSKRGILAYRVGGFQTLGGNSIVM
jgi:hypothetical protein